MTLESMQRMESTQQTKPPRPLLKQPHLRRIALFFGLATGIIDFIYSGLLSHSHFSFGERIPPYLWPNSIYEPPFNVFLTFLYNLPIFLLLLLVFLVVGFIATYKTKRVSMHVSLVFWTGVPFTVMDFLLGKDFVFMGEVYGQLGEASTPVVAREVLLSALLYSLVAGLILIIIGLGISKLGGLLAKCLEHPRKVAN